MIFIAVYDFDILCPRADIQTRKRPALQARGLRSYLARVTNFMVNDSRAYNGVNYFAVRTLTYSLKEIIGEIRYWDHGLSFAMENRIFGMYFAMRYLFWGRNIPAGKDMWPWLFVPCTAYVIISRSPRHDSHGT